MDKSTKVIRTISNSITWFGLAIVLPFCFVYGIWTGKHEFLIPPFSVWSITLFFGYFEYLGNRPIDNRKDLMRISKKLGRKNISAKKLKELEIAFMHIYFKLEEGSELKLMGDELVKKFEAKVKLEYTKMKNYSKIKKLFNFTNVREWRTSAFLICQNFNQEKSQ